LRAGTSYEICLTNAARLPAPPDPYAFYRELRRVHPAPYAAFLRFGDLEVAGSSPERFLRITREGVAEARPVPPWARASLVCMSRQNAQPFGWEARIPTSSRSSVRPWRPGPR
jgi:hypothetical protein